MAVASPALKLTPLESWMILRTQSTAYPSLSLSFSPKPARIDSSILGYRPLKKKKKMPHMGNHSKKEEREEEATTTPPPKGCMPVRVGLEGEEQRRFVVPVAYLSHPLFAELLEEAAEEYGFSQRGAIAIPCGVEHFRHVQDVIDRERGPGGPLIHHCRRHHHHHEQGQQGYHHHHHHLPHFAGCFGA